MKFLCKLANPKDSKEFAKEQPPSVIASLDSGISNNDAVERLQNYIQIINPQFAVLVDAPWGTGKSHLIRQFVNASAKNVNEMGLVSLFDVDCEDSFFSALVRSKKITDFAKLAESFGKFSKVLKDHKLGIALSATKAIMNEMLLRDLPRVLIFDDFERSTYSMDMLIAKINWFVEHEGKSVIIVTDSREIGDMERFNKIKEKIIGATINIADDLKPNFRNLIESNVAFGEARCFMLAHLEEIEKCLSRVEIRSVRKFINSIRSCGEILGNLDSKFFASKEAMIKFMLTYLILYMETLSGNLTVEVLNSRSELEFLESIGSPKNRKYLENLSNRFPDIEVFSAFDKVISLEMGVELFGRGLVPPERLNLMFDRSSVFSNEHTVPRLWERQLYWRRYTSRELQRLSVVSFEYLINEEKIVPGEFLIAASFRLRTDVSGVLRPDNFEDRICERIESLSREGMIPPAEIAGNLGWEIIEQKSESSPLFCFRGHKILCSPDLIHVCQVMRDAQLLALESLIDKHAREIEEALVNDVDKFCDTVHDIYPSSAGPFVPFLDRVDVDRVAPSVYEYILGPEKEKLGKFFDSHWQIMDEGGEGFFSERQWFECLRIEVIGFSFGRGQAGEDFSWLEVSEFLNDHWPKFLDDF